MRIQVDTISKTITLLESINLIELVDLLKKMFPEDYSEYKVYSQSYNYVGYYPWYTWPRYDHVSPTITEPIYNISIE